jgi:hypothetical protein
VNLLKITQTLLDAATVDVQHAATVRAIVSLARELGIGVVTAGFDIGAQQGLGHGSDSGREARDSEGDSPGWEPMWVKR